MKSKKKDISVCFFFGLFFQVNYNEEIIIVFWDDGGEVVYLCIEGNYCVKILDNVFIGKFVQ